MSDWMPSLERWINSRGELQAAVEFTAAKTGFQPTLVEKDFWCSVVLGRLYAAGDCPLVFKGGTLLSKAYVPLDEKTRKYVQNRVFNFVPLKQTANKLSDKPVVGEVY